MFENKSVFRIQVSAGIIQQLSKHVLTTFDFTDAVPREVSQTRAKGAQSFLRLSSTSIMVSTDTSVSVYNPKYQSMLASVQLDESPTSKKSEEVNGEPSRSCNLVSYFPKLGIAVAIANNDLIAVQIEGSSRATGLLIDSLGCSVRGQVRPGRNGDEPKKIGLTTMESYLPGSIGTSEPPMKEQIVPFENAFSSGNTVQFDMLMEDKLGEDWGEMLINGSAKVRTQKRKFSPADVDRRWIKYALSKIFSWTKEDNSDYILAIQFYPPNVFTWLLKTGNMTVANIESALREQLRRSAVDAIPGSHLVNALVQLDPDMDLLHALVSRNFLGAAELLTAIRTLMNSLELFGESPPTKQGLLTSGDDVEMEINDVEEKVKELEEEAEAELAIAEYQLGPGSGVRGEALSLALSKLYTCPSSTIVYALQTIFTSPETVSLIYLLRFELARGAWTSRYIDADQLDAIDDDAETSNSSLTLISSLLNNCIDAIGAGGWLTGDARLVNGDPFEAEELIASLKLEVSAALEGIEEAVYLRGLTSEMIRYGEGVLGQEKRVGPETPASKKRKIMQKQKPILLPSAEEDYSTLPLGLKADKGTSQFRVGAGGEIVERSARDIGRLKSQKVGKYSLERIVI